MEYFLALLHTESDELAGRPAEVLGTGNAAAVLGSDSPSAQ